MSLNLLLEDQTDPVVWRGPIISGTVSQFWTEVCWGDVDYMFVDMPPGTGDVALTVFQSCASRNRHRYITQELVSMIVTKAVKMAEMMNVPVLGIVENMSYFVCRIVEKSISVWNKPYRKSSSRARHLSNRLPALDPKMAALCDEGKMEEAQKDSRKDEQFFINLTKPEGQTLRRSHIKR